MVTLSACLIVKNEQAHIQRCINSLLPICDEVIVVDTGSTDDTIRILENIAQVNGKLKLKHFTWIMDYSAARNYSFSFATSDYVMWVDADEYFSNALIDEINSWKRHSTGLELVFNIDIHVEGSDVILYRTRIVKRSLNPRFEYCIHERYTYDAVNAVYVHKFQNPIMHNRHEGGYWNTYEKYYYKELTEGLFRLVPHNIYYFAWSVDNIILKALYLSRYYVLNAALPEGCREGYTETVGVTLSEPEASLLKSDWHDTSSNAIAGYYQQGFYLLVQALCWLKLSLGIPCEGRDFIFYYNSLMKLGADSEANELVIRYKEYLNYPHKDCKGARVYVDPNRPDYWLVGYYLMLFNAKIISTPENNCYYLDNQSIDQIIDQILN